MSGAEELWTRAGDRLGDAYAFVTSGRILRVGAHDHVRIWIRSALVGELIVEPGDGAELLRMLGLEPRDAST